MATEDEIRNNLRKTLTGLVSTLAHPRSMREYTRVVGGVAGELYCQWFDDLYHPSASLFQSAFSPEALEALGELNSALLACGESVDQCDLDTLLSAEWWRPVQLAAARALGLMQQQPPSP